MARLVTAGLFMSLDGVVEADSDWQYHWFDAELFDVIFSGTVGVDTVLMGRASASGYAALRQEHPESPMLSFLEGVERFVVSGSASGPSWSQWPGTSIIPPDQLAETVRQLKNRTEGKGIQVAGSPSVVRALLAAGLLDELLVMLLPIVVGGGHRFFPEAVDGTGPVRMPLRLLESRALASGAVALRYS